MTAKETAHECPDLAGRAGDRARGRRRPASRATCPCCRARGGGRPGHLDARRPERAVAHRLQLRPRAGPRRALAGAAARHLRPEVHGHRRHGESGDGALPIAHRAVSRERAGAELRVRPARAGQAPAQVRRPRRDAGALRRRRRRDARGGSHGASPQLQHGARLADQRRDRHRPPGRSHPLPRAAGQPVRAADADLVALEPGRRAPSRRGGVSRHAAVVERRLRADGGARRRRGRHRRLGDGDQRQRHAVPERVAAARGRQRQPRAAGARQAGRLALERRELAAAPAPWRRSRSPTITSTRWGGRRRSTTTRPSR